jgi:hypothetical protein
MAQAVSRWPLTAKARFRSRVSPCGICGGQCGISTRSVSHALCTTPLCSHESLISGMCRYRRDNSMTGHTALVHVTI